MILTRKFLLFLLLCWPLASVADVNVNTLKEQISKSATIDAASTLFEKAFKEIVAEYKNKVDEETIKVKAKEVSDKIASAKLCDKDNNNKNNTKTPAEYTDKRTEQQKADDLKKLEDDYKAKKENEQSLANRTLTAATTAATGIGGMELAMGLAEQKADKDAANSMAAYIATMRCTYADGKQLKAGPDEIELPGGNNQQLTNLRAEYFALAADLKERKTALGMKPGIESEEILDKAATGLYDDETKGIDSGAYASLYRAQMLGSDADQEKIDAEQKASKNRVIAGAVVGGVGVVGGIVGNSLINGKLGELIKKDKNCKSIEKLYNATTDSLEKLKSCLRDGGAINTEELSFEYFQADWLSLSDIKCNNLSLKNAKAKGLFLDSNRVEDVNAIVDKLKQSFGDDNTKTMLGAEKTDDEVLQTALKAKISKRASEYQDAIEQDEKSGCNSSFLDGIKTGITDAKKAD